MFTYKGKTDSTPTPATSLLNLNVVFRPAFRLAMTMPFRTETRRLFSGTSCSYQIRPERNQTLNCHYLTDSYHFELDYITRLYIRYLSLCPHFLHCFFIQNLQSIIISNVNRDQKCRSLLQENMRKPGMPALCVLLFYRAF